mgnify:CR=1 FL=1
MERRKPLKLVVEEMLELVELEVIGLLHLTNTDLLEILPEKFHVG